MNNAIRRILRSPICTGLTILLYSTTGWTNTLFLDGTQSKISATEYIQYVIDSTHTYTAQDIIQLDAWKPLEKSNLGYIKSPIWTLLTIQNTSEQTQNLILYNPRAGMDHIQVKLIKNDQAANTWLLGDLYPAENHPIIHRYSAIPILLEPNQKMSILSELKSTGPVEANWIINSTAEFAYTNIQINFIWGLLFGLVLMLTIYHLNLFASLKMPALFVFIGMVVFGAVFQIAINGFLRNIALFENWLEMINLSLWIFYALSLVFLALFAITFFETRKNMPFLHRVLVGLILIEVFVIMFYLYAIFLNPNLLVINKTLQVIAVIAMLIPFFVAFVAIQLKLSGAHLYLIDQFVLVLANSIQIATLTGVITLTHFSALLPALAYVSHTIFIALAIGQRISVMQAQHKKQQLVLLSQNRSANIGQTFSNITHQAKLPLVRLGSQLCLIQTLNQISNDKNHARLNAILPSMRQQVDILQNTVDDFKNFYNVKPHVNSNEISKTTQKVLDLLSGKISMTRTKIQWIKPSGEISIKTDTGALSHVLMILLDNALDFLLERKIEGSTLTMGYDYLQPHVIIWIEDEAGGIQIKPIARIFENFVSDKQQGGIGIGLSIAKLLTEERLFGHIEAINTPLGARFTLRLTPYATAELNINASTAF
ncbi:7TM diverse intracellular signaling domain-containing protein [Thiomicrospira microaerophila]|uniref:7TM diverse intracellular signaling domain-containing protein n=1 Tax=Thiomicrospira microaerophila TaxID=406020 RepID=UPI0005CA5123|nr:sensor histidine kinase [Thiomicrospira microaerophila]